MSPSPTAKPPSSPRSSAKIAIVRNTYYPTSLSNLSFLAPAQLVDGEAFSSVMMSHHELRNLVFEYNSTRPASTNGLLSTSNSTPHLLHH